MFNASLKGSLSFKEVDHFSSLRLLAGSPGNIKKEGLLFLGLFALFAPLYFTTTFNILISAKTKLKHTLECAVQAPMI